MPLLTICDTKKRRKHITHKSQVVSPFPVGDHQAERNRQDSIYKTNLKQIAKRIHKKKKRLGTVRKEILDGLNRLNGTNLTLSSDVDQAAYGKVTKNKKIRCTNQPKGQPFPNRSPQDCKEQKGSIKRIAALEYSEKSLQGLNMFKGTNLTINADVDQDTNCCQFS